MSGQQTTSDVKRPDTNGLYHGGWAFRKDAFYRVRGYGPHNNGEDQELAGRLHEAGVTISDPCEHHEPFYIYRYDNCSYHLSYMDDAGYRELGQHADDGKATISIGWPSDYTKLPVIRRFTFAPHVNPTDDRMPVELIGPVDAPGGNGPSNGMYALQKALRKRIDAGLDWLSIKALPVSEGRAPLVLELVRPPLRSLVGFGRDCRSYKVPTCCFTNSAIATDRR